MKHRAKLTLFDAVVCAMIVLSGMWLASAKASQQSIGWLKFDFRNHLGAEYDAIAQAIVSGRGFSDPFCEGTGPTAWMPPVIPSLLATLYYLFGGVRSHVVNCILLAQGASVFFTLCIVISEARRLKLVIWGYVISAAAITTSFHELFQKTHDVWLSLLVVNLLWIGSYKRWYVAVGAWSWGVFGGVAALCSPILGGVWAVITTFRWFLFGDFNTRSKLIVAALTSVLIVTPWTIRCRISLGAWVPIKSNGMFEVWQSLCLDDDGVLDDATTAAHPYANDGELRSSYKRLGEIAFVRRCREEAIRKIEEQPIDFLGRIANRFFAATITLSSHDKADRSIPTGVWFARIMFPLPFTAAIWILLFRRRRRRDCRLTAALAIYTLMLIPYVLVSYYERYAVPLIGVKSIVLLHAIHYMYSVTKSQK